MDFFWSTLSAICGEYLYSSLLYPLSLQAAYDNKFYENLGSASKAEEFIKRALVHSQAYFCHVSLGTKVHLQLEPEIKHYTDVIFNKQTMDDMKIVCKNDLNGASLMVFFGLHPNHPNSSGGGKAYLRELCRPSYRDKNKFSVNLWRSSIAKTGISNQVHVQMKLPLPK